MSRRAAWLLLFVLAALGAPAQAAFGMVSIREIDQAITELDLARAQKLLDSADFDSLPLSMERARLNIYLGDCARASAILSAPSLRELPEGAQLFGISRTCAQATAAAAVVEVKQHGIWIRLQDDEDRALVPFIADVARRARSTLERDLGVLLPRPLRIDLVRDSFSLSAVSGLAVTAAETTGTVAVARWGRVTMISPRAAPLGYPWEDTLAHEITHLAVTRASGDRAPLWLQEGIAKREETRWRLPRPFDGGISADAVSRAALVSGQSVGIDKIGPSIAMLPSPAAASTAFAEVTSFVKYWIDQNGEAALRLLIADLKGLHAESADGALRSVTGYDLETWNRRWKRYLYNLPKLPDVSDTDRSPQKKTENQDLWRHGSSEALEKSIRLVRLGDLLFERGHSDIAAPQYSSAIRAIPTQPAIRWRAARADLDQSYTDRAAKSLGKVTDLEAPHGAWFALHGRLASSAGDTAVAERDFELGIAQNPLSDDVACEGYWRPRGPGPLNLPPLPSNPEHRALCEAARKIPLGR
ncbi:MAG TPA: hypothetical protein VGJ84_21740 [Polyangiaceae bacterium]